MVGNFLTRAPRGAVTATAASALFAIFLTAVHHVYGAAIYETPWRLHIVYVGIPIAALIAASIYVNRRYPGAVLSTAAAWAAAMAIAGFPILTIGIFEGGYNHLLKNLLYFSGMTELVATLFPAPIYELPNDLFFEVTGVAQLFAGLAAVYFAARIFRPAQRSELSPV